MNEYNFLFENFFCFSKDTMNNELDLNNIIRVILNSKEFTDTDLKISNKPTKSVLMGLQVTPEENGYAYLSGIYYVTDGEIIENRDVAGTIKFGNKEVILLLNITRYNDITTTSELGEIISFSYKTGNYTRFSSYSNKKPTIETINKLDYDKFPEFQKNAVRKIRKGSWCE